ncbi:eCIS core domain-containing protein [Paractinoplanes durhamensis]|uniref:eCIS core domain-containing protein n=1 Tax=Paractinoplanes durhamensis TaxID=113563 RepID=A0ABQ3Z738_9ACTN|nr:DUF4157 domain-containing protein [Actinoplanes durhamensis]GIE05660.1 hypothetical protein Adu01nite_70100 [Actinoplanes durhamensis]
MSHEMAVRAPDAEPPGVRAAHRPETAAPDIRRLIGNRVLRCGPTPCDCGPEERARASLQRSPEVSEPSDPEEIEADHVADQVMRSVAMGDGDEDDLAAKDSGISGGGDRPDVASTLTAARASGGEPLPGPVQTLMENSFGRSLDVRIHRDAAADRLSRSVGAHAVTTGRDVFFAAGRFQPGSDAGLRLIAHELTHVVQQGHATGPKLARKSSGALNCPPYDGYDTSKDLNAYNCAGLAHRSYDFKSLPDTKALLAKGKPVSATGVCGSVGDVQHWLWEYDVGLEYADGSRTPMSRDFHTVGGPTDGDPLPNPPSEVWTKNGHRKVYGPGTGMSFKPVPRDQARTNDAADKPVTDKAGNPIYKVRANFAESSFCLPCLPGKKP